MKITRTEVLRPLADILRDIDAEQQTLAELRKSYFESRDRLRSLQRDLNRKKATLTDAVLEVITSRPGLSVKALCKAARLGQQPLYRALAELSALGRIECCVVKSGRTYRHEYHAKEVALA